MHSEHIILQPKPIDNQQLKCSLGSALRALNGLKLKTVIKENHNSPLQHLCFNQQDAQCHNLFATVAKDQVTIYDDQHMGDHVAVVANLSLSNSCENCKDTFHTCCWINSCEITQHPYGDALLAAAGTDSCIHIISVVEAAVITQLPLPQGPPVVDLSPAAEQPGLVLSLLKDGTLQLWHVLVEQCLWAITTDAVTAVLHPSGRYAITANGGGQLSRWTGSTDVLEAAATRLQPPSAGQDDQGSVVRPRQETEEQSAAAAPAAAAALTSSTDVIKEPFVTLPDAGDVAVDCLRFITSDLLAVKTAGGCMSVHKLPDGQVASSWRVPGCSRTSASASSRCCFSHTADGRFICVGNHNATAFVFDTTTGFQLARVEACKVQGSVKACALSEDCRHLLMVVGDGYIFRFEYRPTAQELNEQMSGGRGAQQQQLLTGSTGNTGGSEAEPALVAQQVVDEVAEDGAS